MALKPSPATAIAPVALFVALGGTSYAALKLPARSVGSKQLKSSAVTRSKLANALSRARRSHPTPSTARRSWPGR
jgi:hypothetical protein